MESTGSLLPGKTRPPSYYKVFCRVCGKPMKVREYHMGFNSQTGQRVIGESYYCPIPWWNLKEKLRHWIE
jgi:hypothetical protein